MTPSWAMILYIKGVDQMGMIPYTEMVDAPVLERKKTSDTIYTLDIEVTSLFKYPDGWDVFREHEPPKTYKGIKRAGVPYIWMFGIEADAKCNVYYGREFKDLIKVFRLISDPKIKKIIWVHNLAYEFQFLRDILEPYTISKLCARQPRKPIRFVVDRLNLEFRCSFMLTNLSLAKAGERYTSIAKKVGDLDYTVKRHPKSTLTLTELGYCEYDIRVLHDVIAHFRAEYGTLSNIPLTQTGEVRKEFRSRVTMKYIYKVQKQTARSAHLQELFMRAFMGGITHASYLHAGRILYDLISADITSDYPAALCAYKYPMGGWSEITPERANSMDRERWAVLYHVTFHNVKSNLINTYILKSKSIDSDGVVYDNGRVLECNWIRMVLTDVDFDIIRESYEIGEIEYHECWFTYKDYLPKELILYILDLYQQKTELKNRTSEDGLIEALYAKSKQRINSIYGAAVTSIFKGEITYEHGEWGNIGLSDQLITDKLEDLRKSRTNCFPYHHGIYCTAYARKRLWFVISSLDASVVGIDKGVCYYDTDSCKAPESEEFRAAREASNEDITKRLHEMCDHYEIPYERLAPKDIYGIEHPLGLFEIDGRYKEFKTLGAKRYAVRTEDDQVHITISGVDAKKGVAALKNDLNNFRKNMVFEYEECGKLTSHYIDDQEPFTFTDYNGIKYRSTQKHGICLQGTEYAMSIKDAFYETLWIQDLYNENRRYE